jgi:hypothetical protein
MAIHVLAQRPDFARTTREFARHASCYWRVFFRECLVGPTAAAFVPGGGLAEIVTALISVGFEAQHALEALVPLLRNEACCVSAAERRRLLHVLVDMAANEDPSRLARAAALLPSACPFRRMIERARARPSPAFRAMLQTSGLDLHDDGLSHESAEESEEDEEEEDDDYEDEEDAESSQADEGSEATDEEEEEEAAQMAAAAAARVDARHRGPSLAAVVESRGHHLEASAAGWRQQNKKRRREVSPSATDDVDKMNDARGWEHLRAWNMEQARQDAAWSGDYAPPASEQAAFGKASASDAHRGSSGSDRVKSERSEEGEEETEEEKDRRFIASDEEVRQEAEAAAREEMMQRRRVRNVCAACSQSEPNAECGSGEARKRARC